MTGRTVVWRRLDGSGCEHATLVDAGGAPRLEGTAVTVGGASAVPVRASYVVTCDAAWRTRAVTVTVATGAGERALRLAADGAGAWWRDGEPLPHLAGLLDVDIAVTPATNTLAVRRLGLAIGEARDVTAAWVSVPGLAVERLPQRYTRLDARRYRYESDEGRFVAEIVVDEVGLVVTYAGGWERVAAAGSRPDPA